MSLSHGGGRPLDAVWLYFTKVTGDDAVVKAVCKGCSVSVSNVVSRLWTRAMG